MNSTRNRMVSIIVAGMMIATGLTAIASGQKSSKASQMIAENQELDRNWVDAYQKKDVDRLMGLYWKSPELVSVQPDGTVAKGWENVRKVYADFFAAVDSLQLQITESAHIPSGDGVFGYGSATVNMKLKNGQHETGTVRFSDFRQKKDGKWVYIHDQAQMVTPSSGPKPTDSLYQRLGGYDAIAAVTDDFIGRLASDAQLKHFFMGSSTDSLKRIRQLVVDQLCAATGGPCLYLGREMKASHAGLGITAQDWDIAVNHLVATLNKFHVPAREQGEVATALTPLRADIVEK